MCPCNPQRSDRSYRPRRPAAVRPLNVTPDETTAAPPEALRDATDVTDVLTGEQAVYFRPPSQEGEPTAKAVGRLALSSLIHAAQMAKRTGRSVPVYCLLDELEELNVGTGRQSGHRPAAPSGKGSGDFGLNRKRERRVSLRRSGGRS